MFVRKNALYLYRVGLKSSSWPKIHVRIMAWRRNCVVNLELWGNLKNFRITCRHKVTKLPVDKPIWFIPISPNTNRRKSRANRTNQCLLTSKWHRNLLLSQWDNQERYLSKSQRIKVTTFSITYRSNFAKPIYQVTSNWKKLYQIEI